MRTRLSLVIIAALIVGLPLGVCAGEDDAPPAAGKKKNPPVAAKPAPPKPGDARRPHARQHTHIDVDRLEHDFGVVAQNTEVTTKFTYTNTSSVAIDGIAAQADCGCNRAELSTTRLEPGASGTLTVSFQTQVLSGRLQKRVRLWSKARTQGEITMRLRISIMGGLILDPGSVSFRDVVHGSSPTTSFDVKWKQGLGKPFKITGVQIPGHESEFRTKVSAYVPKSADDSWRGYVVNVTFIKPPPLGGYSAHLLVRTDHPKHQRLELPLSANVVGKVWMQARVLHFGVVEQGTPRSATLKFRPNQESAPFNAITAKSRSKRVQVQVKPDPFRPTSGLWVLTATVPADASAGRLDEEVVELHTGVKGEEVILIQVRGRVRARGS